jgi:hypothetical protein
MGLWPARDVFASLAYPFSSRIGLATPVCGGGTIGDIEHIRLYLALISQGDHGYFEATIGHPIVAGEGCFFSMHLQLKREADPRELQTAAYIHYRKTQSLNGTTFVQIVLLESDGVIFKTCQVLSANSLGSGWFSKSN